MKKTLKKILNLKGIPTTVSLMLVLILSILVIYMNGLLFFSEFHESIRISFTDDVEIYEEFEELSNISYIDRRTGEIFIENVSLSEVNEKLQTIEQENESVKVDEFVVEGVSAKGSLIELLTSLMLVNLVIITSFGFVTYYGMHIAFNKVNLKSLFEIIFRLIFSIISSSIISFGFISLVSRVYRIQTIEVEMLIIVPVVTVFFYLMSTKGDIENSVSKINSFIKANLYRLYAIFVGFAVFLPIGLSSSSIIPLLIILTTMLTSIVVLGVVFNTKIGGMKKIKNVAEMVPVAKKSGSKIKRGRRTFTRRRRKETKKR